ncbi:signal transduction histidine kinase, LytS [Caldicellulosiruptor hydrothermalis 108]|uniref:histidine kinase n=1 Tax=Caldicellulosiruptor hydrothermalis (strain DSM 18901 / VKM B-2411 / 108) TaxID=632292 RepID=E4Q9X0_CALH1|nr:histidine kinase [Caldicellulosiruptor hydrothermalis]ADQ05845.1 signal transduction histidine kinase, LytS [Caldicellulosiruptor hydrothermalis 108]
MKYIKSLFRLTSIKFKLLLALVVITCIPTLILGYIGYLKYTEILKDKFLKSQEVNIIQISSIIEYYTQNIYNFTQEVLYDNSIYNFYKALIDRNDDSELFDYIFKKDFEGYLNSLLLSRNDINLIAFNFSVNNSLYYVSRENEKLESLDVCTIYQKAKITAGKPIIYVKPINKFYSDVYIGRIVYDRNTLDEIGLLIIKMNLNKMYDSITTLKIKNYDAIAFAYRDKLIYVNFSNSTNLTGLEDLIVKQHKFELSSKFKNNYYFVKSDVPISGWTCYMFFSKKFLLNEINLVSKTLFILFIITVFLSLLLINYIYLDITSPINQLIKYMKKVENGEIQIKIESNRKDEFGYLISSFNRMTEKINHLINQVYKARLIAKDAQIKALQAQINPHFLFNTLDVINWKAKFLGAEEISEMITALATLLEYSINREDSTLVSLQRELEYIDSYIFLVCKRNNHLRNLNFIKDIKGNDLLNYKIPFMTLQPIIENCIKHAFDSSIKDPTILIEIQEYNNNLIIKVKDNGKGIEPEKLAHINNKLNKIPDFSEKDSCGIGLLNVHRRLRLLFGNQYRLLLNSTVGSGTEIILTIPASK